MHVYCFPLQVWIHSYLYFFPHSRKEKNALVFKDVWKKSGYYFLKAIKQQSNIIQSNSCRVLYSSSLLHKTCSLFARKMIHVQIGIPNYSHKTEALRAWILLFIYLFYCSYGCAFLIFFKKNPNMGDQIKSNHDLLITALLRQCFVISF